MAQLLRILLYSVTFSLRKVDFIEDSSTGSENLNLFMTKPSAPTLSVPI